MFQRVYFVLAPSFQGATLLSKLLNAHPEICALGDTYPSNAFDQLCGCGARVSKCPFWQNVKDRVKAERYRSSRGLLPMYPGEHGRTLSRVLFSDFTAHWLTPGTCKAVFGKARLERFRADYEMFLRSVHRFETSPGSVFIDGGKSVMRLSALLASGFPVDGVIHLSRDAGDFVSASMKRTNEQSRFAIAKYSLRYRLYHERAAQTGKRVRYLHVKYEDLVADADAELERIFGFLDTEPLTTEQLQPGLHRTWHFMGNASLFKFDGRLRRSTYPMEPGTRRLVRMVAGA